MAGADAFLRRRWVHEMGSWSATPVYPMPERLQALDEHFEKDFQFWEGDLTHYELVAQIFEEFRPDAIVHLGECPSAPYSMIDAEHCAFVQRNNLVSTTNFVFAMEEFVPDAHLVKLGTMGEYGTPNVAIPEGFFELEYRGRTDRLPFPRQAGSWYHWSKVHGSNNVMFACRLWGLRATDIMQGVVFGTRIDDMAEDDRLLTRLDFDQAFGTAINRFCCQALIGHPLTPFGLGHQKRGFLPLRDSMQCLTLTLENPPDPGEYRVFNQFQEVFDITELAMKVQAAAGEMGLDVEVRNIENPRLELEDHFYAPDHQHLFDLGYTPSDVEEEVGLMLRHLQRYTDRIEAKREVLIPDVRWDGRREKTRFLDSLVTSQAEPSTRFTRAAAETEDVDTEEPALG